MILTVCSRCGSTVRRCSPNCTMGGAVHVATEKHLCNPGHAFFLLRRPDMWDKPHMFAHLKAVAVD